jgi:hypothetical protein
VMPFTEAPCKPICVKEREEELEVVLLAVVRRGCEQQQMSRQSGQKLSEMMALGLLDLVAKNSG